MADFDLPDLRNRPTCSSARLRSSGLHGRPARTQKGVESDVVVAAGTSAHSTVGQRAFTSAKTPWRRHCGRICAASRHRECRRVRQWRMIAGAAEVPAGAAIARDELFLRGMAAALPQPLAQCRYATRLRSVESTVKPAEDFLEGR